MSTLKTETRGAVCLITLTRPEVRNALSVALQVDLSQAFADALADKQARAVVLNG